MASNLNDSFPEDQLLSYMSFFRHLLCPHPDFQFRKPPPSDVKEAQSRSVYDFFISYRHQMSGGYAQTLSNELKEFGYQVYFAGQVPELESLDDELIREKLQSALHMSSVFVIIGNKNMFAGEWVAWEMETFYEDHWGRKVPIITEEMGSPITNDQSLESLALKQIRQFDTSAAIIYEEDNDAWKNQKPSAITIFCLLLVREFYRVELEFWHNWSPMSANARYRLYLESMYKDRVCRYMMAAMLMPHPDYSLAQLKNRYLKEAREYMPPPSRKKFGFWSLFKSIMWPLYRLKA
ncbi:MAG: hypothetical protein JWO06_3411 [Bacteroidota bacterium]|nr:hypothetical protein [Bacteroidota bacterium]